MLIFIFCCRCLYSSLFIFPIWYIYIKRKFFLSSITIVVSLENKMSRMPGMLGSNNRLFLIANITKSYKKRSLGFVNNPLKFAVSNDISGKRCCM